MLRLLLNTWQTTFISTSTLMMTSRFTWTTKRKILLSHPKRQQSTMLSWMSALMFARKQMLMFMMSWESIWEIRLLYRTNAIPLQYVVAKKLRLNYLLNSSILFIHLFFSSNPHWTYQALPDAPSNRINCHMFFVG